MRQPHIKKTRFWAHGKEFSSADENSLNEKISTSVSYGERIKAWEEKGEEQMLQRFQVAGFSLTSDDEEQQNIRSRSQNITFIENQDG